MAGIRLALRGRKQLREQGRPAQGRVVGTRTLWWLKVNTKPVRRHMADGARFPHAVTFSYQVDGRRYTGRDILNWSVRCPAAGEPVQVRYDPARPERCVLLPPPAALDIL